MRVYHFVNQRFGLDDLKRRRLKIATIEDLNDPFEMLGFKSRDQKIRKAWSLVRALTSSSLGMICFSKNWSNPVQWSHYADGHRGLCLGFDVPKKLMMDVIYSDKRSEPNLEALESGGLLGIQELKRILSTKFTHWQYENEMRSMISLRSAVTANGLYFEKFSAIMCLREVIVGHRSPITRKQLSDVIKEGHEVTTIKARLSFNDFKIVRQKNDRLWA